MPRTSTWWKKMNDATQVLRIAKISSIDYAKGTASVTFEDREKATTDKIPFLSWFYRMPKVADRVLVGYLTNGSSSAVILGPVWNEKNRPSESGKGVGMIELGENAGTAYVRWLQNVLTLHGATVNLDGDVKLKGRTATLQATLSNLESRVSELESDVSTLESKVSSLQSTVSSLQSTVSSHTSDISNLKTRATSLENSRDDHERRIKALENA